jgi:hypothetical protein
MTGLETVLSLAQVAQRLDRAGITWAVFAGAAANTYGSPRPLTDVDILIPLAKGNRVAAMFPGAHTVRQEDGTVRSIKLPGFDLVAGLTMFDADAAYDVDLDEQMAARRTCHEIDGVTVPVIPPEDNILLKAVWDRGPEEGKHDWEDVLIMLSCLPVLDWDYLCWRASTCGPAKRVQEAVKRLEKARCGVTLQAVTYSVTGGGRGW